MDGHEHQQEGMGPSASGPQFVPGPYGPEPPGGAWSSPTASPPAPAPDFSPPASRFPAVLTAVVIATVASVVLAATLVAREADQRVGTRVAASAGPSPTVDRGDRIEFTSRTGAGRLILEGHSWDADRVPAPVSGSYLTVEIAIECESGSVDYDPDLFQAFDANGRLFQLAMGGADGPLLDIGTLAAGERVSGALVFDIPRGAVTLLMTDDSEQTVTALRVPD